MRERCESAWRLTPDQRRRQTPPSVLEVTDFQQHFGQAAGSRLDVDRGQTAEPKHTQRRPATNVRVLRGP
jgi:hypothetical protein